MGKIKTLLQVGEVVIFVDKITDPDNPIENKGKVVSAETVEGTVIVKSNKGDFTIQAVDAMRLADFRARTFLDQITTYVSIVDNSKEQVSLALDVYLSNLKLIEGAANALFQDERFSDIGAIRGVEEDEFEIIGRAVSILGNTNKRLVGLIKDCNEILNG